MTQIALCTTIIDVVQAKGSVVICLDLARIEPDQLLSRRMNSQSQDGHHGASTSYQAEPPSDTRKYYQRTRRPPTSIFKKLEFAQLSSRLFEMKPLRLTLAGCHRKYGGRLGSSDEGGNCRVERYDECPTRQRVVVHPGENGDDSGRTQETSRY
jgi:hypothetical protein